MLNLGGRRGPTAPRAVTCAILIHAVVLGAALLAPAPAPSRPRGAADAPSRPPEEEIAIETELEPAAEAAAAPMRHTTEANADGAATSPRSSLARVTRAMDRPAGNRAANETTAKETSSRETTANDAAAIESPPANVFAPPSLGIALGAPNPFATRGALADDGLLRDAPSAMNGAAPSAPSAAEAKRRVEASLGGPARERNRALGLGPDGPVLAALEQATYASTAPVEGAAVFLAVADGEGTVEKVDVLACDGGRAGWENAAALARAALDGVKLRVAGSAFRSFVRRTVMTVQVTSAAKMPSGHDAGINATVLGVPVRKGEGRRSTNVAILDPIPKVDTVEVEVLPGLKIKVTVTHWDPLALEGDPVDIGAKPRRVVHTRVTHSAVL